MKEAGSQFYFYKPWLLPFFALASSRSERTASTFYNPVPVARTVGRFTLPVRQKRLFVRASNALLF